MSKLTKKNTKKNTKRNTTLDEQQPHVTRSTVLKLATDAFDEHDVFVDVVGDRDPDEERFTAMIRITAGYDADRSFVESLDGHELRFTVNRKTADEAWTALAARVQAYVDDVAASSQRITDALETIAAMMSKHPRAIDAVDGALFHDVTTSLNVAWARLRQIRDRR